MTAKPSTPTLNIAHRGARSLAPENTLPAAQKGLEAGADMWELDVGLTADGVLFLIHDDTLERTSNAATLFPDRAPWNVHDFTWAEIQQLDFGSWFNETDPFEQIAAGQVSAAEQAGFVGLAAPTLAEALQFTRENEWRVNVEIKDLRGTPGEAQVVAQVVALVEAMGMVDQVLISSFNHAYLTDCQRLNPALRLGALLEEAVPDPLALLKRLKVQAYNPYDEIISPATISEIQAHGFAVNVFTVNDVARLRELVAAQVAGIFTDFPQMLRQILQEAWA